MCAYLEVPMGYVHVVKVSHSQTDGTNYLSSLCGERGWGGRGGGRRERWREGEEERERGREREREREKSDKSKIYIYMLSICKH